MLFEVRIGLWSNPEGLVDRNTKGFLGLEGFFLAQRGTVGTTRTLLCRSSLTDNAVQDDERRPIFFRLGSGGERGDILETIHGASKHLPAICFETFCDILRESDIRRTIDTDMV